MSGMLLLRSGRGKRDWLPVTADKVADWTVTDSDGRLKDGAAASSRHGSPLQAEAPGVR